MGKALMPPPMPSPHRSGGSTTVGVTVTGATTRGGTVAAAAVAAPMVRSAVSANPPESPAVANRRFSLFIFFLLRGHHDRVV
jgi:hypothetical protein